MILDCCVSARNLVHDTNTIAANVFGNSCVCPCFFCFVMLYLELVFGLVGECSLPTAGRVYTEVIHYRMFQTVAFSVFILCLTSSLYILDTASEGAECE